MLPAFETDEDDHDPIGQREKAHSPLESSSVSCFECPLQKMLEQNIEGNGLITRSLARWVVWSFGGHLRGGRFRHSPARGVEN